MKTITTLLMSSVCLVASAVTTWKVGPSRTYTKPSEVSTLAQNGDTIEIDAATYVADVARWAASNITLRGVGGMAVLDAKQTAYGQKGIWVIAGSNVTVEKIEFANSHDVSGNDANWAGIRMEGAGLTVKNCSFHDNDNGILESNVVTSDIVIQYTEFNHNGFGDGFSHNLYIGKAKSLNFSFNYSHHASIGHELKSRASANYILYNRIGNEALGDASREIDLPSGGMSVIMGNMIQQGPNTSNSNIVGYGMEGLTNAGPHELYLVNNTIVNDRSAGSFVQISTSTVQFKAYNNIFAGPGSLFSGTATVIDTLKNWRVPVVANAGLINSSAFDYHLLSTSPAINSGGSAGTTIGGFTLSPICEYKNAFIPQSRTNVGVIDIGAYEFGNVSGIGTTTSAPVEFYVYTDLYSNTINTFFANLQADKDVYIYDITGKLLMMKERMASSKISFDRYMLAPGIYIAQAKIGNSLMSKKFIIQ